MPSYLALFFCLIFITALLALDRRSYKSPSWTVWIPTCWMIYSASKPLPYWFFKGSLGVEDLSESIIEGSSMDRNLLLILMVFGLLILVRRKINWAGLVKDNSWLLLLFLYMLISLLWSDYPFVSFKRWFKTTGSIVMALVVLTGPAPRQEIESVLRRTVYILMPFSALLVKYFPAFGVQWGRYNGLPMWVGVTTGKNQLGTLCMISAFFLIWSWAEGRKQPTRTSFLQYGTIAHLTLLFLTFWLMAGSGVAYSATSFSVLALGLVVLLTLNRLKTITKVRVSSTMLLAAAGVVYLLITILSINPLEIIASIAGRDSTLTGRNEIWEILLPVALKNQWVGVGYGAYWIKPIVFDKLTINQAHNGYLDVFVELGVIGLVLLSAVIIMFIRKAILAFKIDVGWGSFLLTLILMSLAHNFTESSFLKSTIFIWNVLVLAMVGYQPDKNAKPTGISQYAPVYKLESRT